jgi:hypothetical protein
MTLGALAMPRDVECPEGQGLPFAAPMPAAPAQVVLRKKSGNPSASAKAPGHSGLKMLAPPRNRTN